MTDDDRPAFAEAMHLLAETFNEHVSEVRAEGYFDALRDWSIVDVNRAVRLALRACKFFPKPIELIELLNGTADMNADAAWGELIRAVRQFGYARMPTFTDERTMRAIRETWGSWSQLCETLPNEGGELVGWMKQFKSAFQSLERRDVGRRLEPGAVRPDTYQFINRERERLAAGGTNNFMQPPPNGSSSREVPATNDKVKRFERRLGGGKP
jgi:hypothetical protein